MKKIQTKLTPLMFFIKKECVLIEIEGSESVNE